jgi:hypothetical protein
MHRERFLPPDVRRFWAEAQGQSFQADITVPDVEGGVLVKPFTFVVRDVLPSEGAVKLRAANLKDSLVLRLVRRRDGSKVFTGAVGIPVPPRHLVILTGLYGTRTVSEPARTIRVRLGINLREIVRNRAKRALVEQLLSGLTGDILRHVLLPYLDPLEGVNLDEQ